MNGDRALAYARTRHSAGDDDARRERQMLVMQAVLVRALQIDSVRTLPDIVKRLGNNMQTSLPYDAQLSLMKMGRKIGTNGVTQYSIRTAPRAPLRHVGGRGGLPPRLDCHSPDRSGSDRPEAKGETTVKR